MEVAEAEAEAEAAAAKAAIAVLESCASAVRRALDHTVAVLSADVARLSAFVSLLPPSTALPLGLVAGPLAHVVGGAERMAVAGWLLGW